jgi:feruloyl-CoA synthase
MALSTKDLRRARTVRPPDIGVPLPEVTLKLIPDEDGRCELRLKGPNVLKGYYRDLEKSKETFDDEGFLITNDAVKFIDGVHVGKDG